MRTYRPGYFPVQTARLERLKIYRNNNKGIEIHRVHNFAVVDSIFADNNVAVDVDRAEDIFLENLEIVGESESYRQLMNRENVEWVCRNQRLIGLELHSWKLHEERGGLTVNNITFSGFTGAFCRRHHSIFMDRLVRCVSVYYFSHPVLSYRTYDKVNSNSMLHSSTSNLLMGSKQ